MKQRYLTFNVFTSNYIYYEKKEGGVLWKNRQDLGQLKENDLVKKLNVIMDKKKKSILHLENIPEERLHYLKNYFLKLPNSKILVQTKK